MALTHCLLIFTLFISSFQVIPQESASKKNREELQRIKENQKKAKQRSDLEKKSTGHELDTFTKCRVEASKGDEAEREALKVMQETKNYYSDEIKKKEKELEEAKKKLEEAKKKQQDMGQQSMNSEVIKERNYYMKLVNQLQDELSELRNKSNIHSTSLAIAQIERTKKMAEEKLKSPNYRIFELTAQELDEYNVSGEYASYWLQMMALATSGMSYLDCRNVTSHSFAKSYYLFKGAAALYMNNTLGKNIDYTQFANCLSKEGIQEHEKGDEQVFYLRKGRNFYALLANYAEREGTGLKSINLLFKRALLEAQLEHKAKVSAISISHLAYTTALKNLDDAKTKEIAIGLGVGAAIVMFAWILAGSLSAWLVFDLMPARDEAEEERTNSKTKLSNAHNHTKMKCNQNEARRWDLRPELENFEKIVEAQEKEKKEQESKNVESNTEEGTKTSFLPFFLKEIFVKTFRSLFPGVKASNEELLDMAVETHKKNLSESEEKLKGGKAEEYITNIPDSFVPGTPAAAKVVEAYKKRYLVWKKAYENQFQVVQKQEEVLKDNYIKMNDLVEKYGDVAGKKPWIYCSYEMSSDKHHSTEYSPEEEYEYLEKNIWPKYGCTTDNQKIINDQNDHINSLRSEKDNSEKQLETIQLSLDKAEIDYITLKEIHEAGPGGENKPERLEARSRQGAAYLSFLSKIKAEWNTSSWDARYHNRLIVDETSDSDVERILKEHKDLKNLPSNKKAGMQDAYTRLIYMQYASNLMDLILKIVEKTKGNASQNLNQYQGLLSQVEEEMAVGGNYLPDQISQFNPKPPCMEIQDGSAQADPACNCSNKGTCAKVDFPTAALSLGEGNDSGNVYQSFINSSLNGDTNSARVNGQIISKNATNIRNSINENYRSYGGGKSYKSTASNLSSTVNKQARNMAGMTKTPPGLGLSLRKSTLSSRFNNQDAEPEATPVSATPTLEKKIAQLKKVVKKKKKKVEIDKIVITDEELEGDEDEEEDDKDLMNIPQYKGPKKGGKGQVKMTAEEKKMEGVTKNPTEPLWDIVSKRYRKSGYNRLLKRKKKITK